MSLDQADVRTILSAAALDLQPAPELIDRVRHGGTVRRRRHRRIGVLTAAALVVTLLGAGALLRTGPEPAAPLAPVPGFDEPTRGDLAGDDGYRQAVLAAWQNWTGHWQQDQEDPAASLGATHLSWALSSPAGRVAVIAQLATVREDGATRPVVVVGYLCDSHGRPAVVEVVSRRLDQPLLMPEPFIGNTAGVFVGGDRSELVAFDPGVPVGLSLRRDYQPDGSITREWQALHFTNGVAIVPVPPRADQGAAVIAEAPYAKGPTLYLANVSATPTPYAFQAFPARVRPDGRLFWGLYNLDGPDQGGKPDPANCVNEWTGDWQTTPFHDPLSGAELASGEWAACGTTPDGSHVTVSDGQIDGDPAFVWYGLRTPAGVTRFGYVGLVDKAAALPVLAKLPNGQGYVVARAAAFLRYRVGTGPWLGGRYDAALVPADTAAVLVSAGGTDTVVPVG